MFFNHLPELLGLLVLGLLIFGPRRMIEMGSQLGRALRETQAALKDMNWGLGEGKTNPLNSSQSTLGKLSQLAQTIATPTAASADAPAQTPTPSAPSPRVVESTAQPQDEAHAE